MPRPANNDPAVLLERAERERTRWRNAQETYLERPENAKKHKEAVNNYYEANKERLKAKANERNALKRKEADDAKAKALKDAELLREAREREMMAGEDRNVIVQTPAKKRRVIKLKKPTAPDVIQHIPAVTPVEPVKTKRKYVKTGKYKKVAPVVIPKNEFIKEHTDLVNLLESGAKDGKDVKKKLKKQAEKQKAELNKINK